MLTTPPGTGRFGLSIAIGNLDGIGGDEVLGAPSGGTGQVFVYSNGNFSSYFPINTQPISPPLVSGGSFGTQVSIGDVAGDSHPDIIVGARGRDIGGYTDAGAVFVFEGPEFSNFLNMHVDVLRSSIPTIAKGDELEKGLAVADIHGGTSPANYADVIAATSGTLVRRCSQD